MKFNINLNNDKMNRNNLNLFDLNPDTSMPVLDCIDQLSIGVYIRNIKTPAKGCVFEGSGIAIIRIWDNNAIVFALGHGSKAGMNYKTNNVWETWKTIDTHNYT